MILYQNDSNVIILVALLHIQSKSENFFFLYLQQQVYISLSQVEV
jgi:hypothetical protein